MPEKLTPPREDLPEWAAYLAASLAFVLAEYGAVEDVSPSLVLEIGALLVGLASGIRHGLRWLDRRRAAKLRAARAAELAHARAMYRAEHGLPPEGGPHDRIPFKPPPSAVPTLAPDESTPVVDAILDDGP